MKSSQQRWRGAIIVLSALMTGIAERAVAAEPAERVANEITIEIPPQAIEAALMEFSRQTGLHVMLYSDYGRGITSPRLSGRYTPAKALDALLAHTGLRYEYLDAQSVAVFSDKPAEHGPAAASRNMRNEGRGFQRLADVSSGPARSAVASDSSETALPPDKDPTESKRNIPEILVKGSRVLDMDIKRTSDDSQPYVVFSRDTIEQSGAQDLQDFLKNQLTMNASSTSPSQSPLTAGSNSSSINLRGLGANQTLILIDGHRIAGYSQADGSMQQPDINGIPLSAIERIEVLPTTASGIYGGSATGGVINVILRRDYSGVETKLTYGGSYDGGASSRRVDVSAGTNLEGGKTNLMIAASYYDSNPLLLNQRNFAQRGRAFILSNDPGYFYSAFAPPLGATTNIQSLDGSNLTLKPSLGGGALNSPITHIPAGYAGAASDNGAGLVASSGKYDLGLANTPESLGGGQRSLLNDATVESVITTVRREFTSYLSAFVELDASNNSGYARFFGAPQPFTIPASSPNNPFNQDIQVTTPAFGAEGTAETTNYNRRAVAGVIAKLTHEWKAEADYTWNRTRYFSSSPGGLSAGAGDAVASGSLDVLRDTNVYPVNFSQFVQNPAVSLPTYTTLKDATLRVAGPLPLKIFPGGDPTLSVLAEHRDDSVSGTTQILQGSSLFVPSRTQSIDSVYSELQLPIISPSNNLAWVKKLDLQLAARWDDYKVTGSTNGVDPSMISEVTRVTARTSSTNPTLGVRFQPTLDLTLRASYGTGFLPPGVNQLAPLFAPVKVPGSLLGLTDPKRGNEPVGDFLLSSSSGHLEPEKSSSWSAGIILTPQPIPGLRLSVDWTRIRKTNEIRQIAQLNEADFGNEAFVPGLIVRGAPSDGFAVGPVTGINAGLFNVARRTLESYDFALSYQLDTTRVGAFDLAMSATRLVHLKSQITPSSPEVEDAGAIATIDGTDGGLIWRATADLTWKYRSWTLGWATHFFDSYYLNTDHSVVPQQGSATVPSQVYHDIYFSYTVPGLPSFVGELLSGTEWQGGVKNVFNTKPPIDVVGITTLNDNGYSAWGDPRLASYYFSVRKHF